MAEKTTTETPELKKPKKLFADKKSESTPAPAPKKAKDSGMRTMPIDGGTITMPKDEPYGLERPFKKGGSVGSASKRADGCAQRGKTKGKMV